MVKAQGTPFAVPPATMATMCKHLYQVGRPEDNDDGGGRDVGDSDDDENVMTMEMRMKRDWDDVEEKGTSE